MNISPAYLLSRFVRQTLWAAAIALLVLGATKASAKTFQLDDPASPIAVRVDGDTGRMSVTLKCPGTVWRNPSAGGDALTLKNAILTSPLRVVADATSSKDCKFQLAIELLPPSGDLVVTIGGDPSSPLSTGLDYPYAFFPPDGSGFAVLPFLSGYVVPTSETNWRAPWPRCREWFGGADAKLEQGWMCIGEPAADMQLVTANGTVAGQNRMGGVFHWIGSIANPAMAPNRLCYPRKAIFRFFSSGGYVAQAKHFREYAKRQGWFVSLKEKAARNPNLEKLLGGPIIYLWGDGRSERMLDALKAAGVEKALLQISINNTDHFGKFPSAEFPDNDGWSKAVRKRGYVPGIYDIYAAIKVRNLGRGGTQCLYDGYRWLWPAEQARAEWSYVRPPGTPAGRGPGGDGICPQMAAIFARDVRIPKQIAMFDVDAILLDTVCAVGVRECYDKEHGHAASRAEDIVHRQQLLAASFTAHNRLTGTEQINSWAIPSTHWAEGAFKIGEAGTWPPMGQWNNNAYPEIMTHVFDPGQTISSILTVGWQVPLWDLVFHDTLIVVPHWHSPNNKYVYAWDHYDLFAILRGQAPLLNLVYNGDKGKVGTEVVGQTDARDGKFWDMRMTNPNVRDHITRTYRNVCQWHGLVAEWELVNHRVLKDDFSVQVSEFSADGGKTGRGVVVNFGVFDGKYAMTGPAWSGKMRGQELTVPTNSFQTYIWR